MLVASDELVLTPQNPLTSEHPVCIKLFFLKSGIFSDVVVIVVFTTFFFFSFCQLLLPVVAIVACVIPSTIRFYAHDKCYESKKKTKNKNENKEDTTIKTEARCNGKLQFYFSKIMFMPAFVCVCLLCITKSKKNKNTLAVASTVQIPNTGT